MKTIAWICMLISQLPLIAIRCFGDDCPMDDARWEGRWALTLPGGGAGWLGITKHDGYWDAHVLWGGGSVSPAANVVRDGDGLLIYRMRELKRMDAEGVVIRTQYLTETWELEQTGDALRGVRRHPRPDGSALIEEPFFGQRVPALPPRPDLAEIQFGEPLSLFNGRNLDGWELTDPRQTNGWSAEDGQLINRPVQSEGSPRVRYGNLRTVQEFEDFRLTLEFRVPERGNSGVYLRGIYEVQVFDSFDRESSALNMGAIYSRIEPLVRAEKPSGEWQTLDITLAQRHVTVILNDVIIIDNQPVEGITGGALWSDESRPGPIYLQGDHTGVDYRNLVLRPVLQP